MKIFDGLKKFLKLLIPLRNRVVLRSHIKWWLSIWMFGGGCECPCCESRVWQFGSGGTGFGFRSGAMCTRCGCMERHRLMWLYLKEKTKFFLEPHRVLEIAPRYWLQKRCLSMKNLNYISIDLFDPVAMKKMDVTALAFKNGEFDCVFCSSVFETVPDDRCAMREVFRVLKPGGWALIHVYVDWSRNVTFEDGSVNTPEGREKYYGGQFNCRIYGADYLNRLEAAGFNVKCSDYVSTFSSLDIKKYGLNNVKYIFHCLKPNDSASQRIDQC